MRRSTRCRDEALPDRVWPARQRREMALGRKKRRKGKGKEKEDKEKVEEREE